MYSIIRKGNNHNAVQQKLTSGHQLYMYEKSDHTFLKCEVENHLKHLYYKLISSKPYSNSQVSLKQVSVLDIQ